MKFNVLLIAANVRKGGAHRINNSQDELPMQLLLQDTLSGGDITEK